MVAYCGFEFSEQEFIEKFVVYLKIVNIIEV